jgi:predicted phosphodiesterase
MKLLALADLHHDFYDAKRMDPLKRISEAQLHAVTHCVLAGDLTNKGHKRWRTSLEWIGDRIPEAKIFIMPGKHYYYDSSIDREDKLRDTAQTGGATFVQKSELIFGQHRILCCSLWTDFEIYGDRAASMRHASTHMNDYHLIRVAKEGYRKLAPAHTAQIHLDHRRWLEEKLAKRFDGETTIITHHANALIDQRAIGPCYASNLEAMILKYQPERWIYGHTHHRVKFTIGQTRLVNVSVGYPGQMELIDTLDRFTFDLEE